MSHTVEILSVGTELLLGSIVNSDAQALSRELSALGLNVLYHSVPHRRAPPPLPHQRPLSAG